MKIIWTAILLCLSIIGIATSSYLEYLGGVGVCPVGFSGCEAVLHSPYSKIFGVSLSLLGLIWFTGLLLLTILSLYQRRILNILLSYSLVSVPSVIILVWIEVALVRSICIYCTIAHLVGLTSILPSYKLWKTFQKTEN
ncbi:MAG: vitamin K epoxide reductase family protein [Nitrososphaerota archaeon]